MLESSKLKLQHLYTRNNLISEKVIKDPVKIKLKPKAIYFAEGGQL